MSKIKVSEALEMFDVSQSGIYRDMDKGIISFEKDERGKKVIDIAELQRVYELRENGNSQKTEMGENGNAPHHEVGTNGNAPPHEVGTNGNAENGAVIAVLEEQVELLKEQLDDAKSREKEMVTERQQLTDMLQIEQKKTEMLMLPPPKAKGSFLNYFRLKR